MGCNTCNQKKCVTKSCACKIFINSDCLNDVKSVFTCLEIETGLTLTQTLEEMDAQICALFESVTNYFTLINVGEGAGVYKGVNNLGQKEIKSLSKTGDLITITPATNEIVFSIDEEALTNFIEDIIPTTVGCFNSPTNTITIGEDVEGCTTLDAALPCITSTGDTIKITTNLEENCINLESEPTLIEDGESTRVSGEGTSLSPYSLEIFNLQKSIDNFPYTLNSDDDKHTIFIENGATNVVINVPDGLVTNFSVVFIQEGIGEVTVQQSGASTLLYPSTTLQNKIKGQYYWAMVEKKLNTNTYYLMGSLLTV